MNNQPLPKPSQSQSTDDPNINSGVTTPPPSALGDTSKNTEDNKNGVVFDGDQIKSRIPLAQKLPDQQASTQNKVGDNDIALPPTSLSALSSMSSNKIPDSSKGSNLSITQTSGSIKKPNYNLIQDSTPPAPSTSSLNSSTTSPVSSATTPVSTQSPTLNQGQSTTQTQAQTQTPASSIQERTVLGRPIPQAIRGEALPVGISNDRQPPIIVQEKSAPIPQMNKDQDGNVEQVPKPKFAIENKSIFKYLPFVVGGVIILAIIGFLYSKFFGSSSTSLPKQNPDSQGSNSAGESEKRTEVPAQQTELTYWGLWEPDEVLEDVIKDFETANPTVKINYIKQSHKDYRERLQTALDSSSGPDVFRFHASWAPMLKSGLSPIPANIISSKEFKDNYYPIVTDQLVVGGQYVGIPLMYDGLALYYNEEILASANETPPSTWAELRLLAAKLTVRSANGIERAGLAIGNTDNVDHFSDILAVLMLQNGAKFSDPNSQETKDALLFYTNFVLKDKVWDSKLPSSTVAFARGDVAMMFAPSWRAHEISAQNPKLKFKTMTLPQLSDERIAWGSYWAEGINSNSKNKTMAADFLGFLNKDESLVKLYSKASEIRSFGEIYPKVSMAAKVLDNEVVASYLDDAVYAQNWYLNSFTHDNGLNDQMIEYYKDGINAVLNGEAIDDVLLTIEAGTKQVLKQYGISSK